jgi:hypothetical protein
MPNGLFWLIVFEVYGCDANPSFNLGLGLLAAEMTRNN